jgi:hypothetical protein
VTISAPGLPRPRVLRFTWRQVIEQTVRVAQLLARTPHHALDTPPAGG